MKTKRQIIREIMDSLEISSAKLAEIGFVSKIRNQGFTDEFYSSAESNFSFHLQQFLSTKIEAEQEVDHAALVDEFFSVAPSLIKEQDRSEAEFNAKRAEHGNEKYC